MAEYRKEMGPPPQDIDQLSALPPAQRRPAEKKAAAQTKKDYPQPTKAPVKKMASGGMPPGAIPAPKGAFSTPSTPTSQPPVMYRDTEKNIGIRRAAPPVRPEIDQRRRPPMQERAKGGSIKGYAKGGTVDGCAQRGKTRGRIVR